MCDHEKKYAYLVGAGSIFLAYLLIQYLILPDMFTGFIRNALTVVGESGVVGPSTHKFVKEIFRMITQISGPVSPTIITMVVIGLAATVVFLSGRACLLLKRSLMDHEDNQKIILFLVCLVYALIHPRFKDYAYMLLIVPSYYIIGLPAFDAAGNRYPFLGFVAVFSVNDRIHHLGTVPLRNIFTGA
jgi:dolichol kinase